MSFGFPGNSAMLNLRDHAPELGKKLNQHHHDIGDFLKEIFYDGCLGQYLFGSRTPLSSTSTRSSPVSHHGD